MVYIVVISTTSISCASIMDLKVTLLAVLATLSYAKEATYELVLSDENVFSACPDAAAGTLDIHGLFDFSEFTTSMEENGVLISGNQTVIWDIQTQDRIKMIFGLLYFDRGTWTRTIYSLTVYDFCKSMYDSRQPWYNTWTGHVKNVEDVRHKCIYPGTNLILEPYLLSFTEKLSTLREGLYKIHYKVIAFDSNGNERPTNICFEIFGTIQKKM